jgi:hypothetical protein
MPRFPIPTRRSRAEAAPSGRRRGATVARPLPAPRELAARVNDGLRVLLLWHPADDLVTVSVADQRTGDYFETPVARDRALHAFYHPFAYGA